MTRVPPLLWTVLGASAMTTLGSLPVFLLGAQSVLIRDELGFGAGRFGIAVSAFFGAAALAALLGGSTVDRLGRRTSTILAGTLTAAGGAGMALVPSWAALVALMVLLGVGNAACQVTSNLAMAQVVPPHRRGLGFGVKQSAIPLSIVIAGLAVPVVATVVGWRWTFAATALGGAVTVVAGLRQPAASRPAVGSAQLGLDRPPRAALLVTMLAIMLASASANSLGSFVASWAVRVGLSPGQAGLLMALGSAVNIAMRIGAGHLADHRHGRNLPVVAAQMGVGAVAVAALSFGTAPVLVPAALLAFAVGWSWPGLLLFAVVRVGRDAPASASGYVQAGAFAGGAAGPVLFGALVSTAGYPVAWRCAAVGFLTAASLVLLARRLFVADLEARPPARPIGYGGGRSAPRRTTSRAGGAGS
ncbi:MAG TPA: MFS transporter [Nocardioidaceae bacterium]|nr:MFS transporter [Nocardioidaceae bacterium]